MANIHTSPPFTKDNAKRLQQIYGKFLYYIQALDTMMHSLNTVATQVTLGIEKTNKAINHFMDYCASNPNAVKLYIACDRILMIHGDAAY